MKTYKKIFYNLGLMSAMLLGLISCDPTKVNVSPQNAQKSPLSALLTGAESSLGFIHQSYGIGPNIFMQQFSGALQDLKPYDQYILSPFFTGGLWSQSYVTVLNQTAIIEKQSIAENAPIYTGISRVLTAIALGTLVDDYGDVPYNQAFAGTDNVKPAFDDAAGLYNLIQTKLDSAIADFSRSPNTFSLSPQGDDVILGGNAANWIAVAYTLNARYALHLSKIDPEAAARAKGYLYGPEGYRGIKSNSGDAQVNYGLASTNNGAIFQEQSVRNGWITLGAAFVNLLNGNSTTDPYTTPRSSLPGFIDPRRSSLASNYGTAANPLYRGKPAGQDASGQVSIAGPFYGRAIAPHIFVSYAEAKFIEAEAELRLGSITNANDALKEAVKASFNKLILTSNAAVASDPFASAANQDSYVAARATITGADFDTNLNTIITQKYIALFAQTEVWNDWRRTGFPVLNAAAGGTNSLNPTGEIPRRLNIPPDEYNLNSSAPRNTTLQTPRIFWDK